MFEAGESAFPKAMTMLEATAGRGGRGEFSCAESSCAESSCVEMSCADGGVLLCYIH